MKSTIRFPFLASTLAVVALGAVACSSSSLDADEHARCGQHGRLGRRFCHARPTAGPVMGRSATARRPTARRPTARRPMAQRPTARRPMARRPTARRLMALTTDGATTDGATTDGATTDGETADGGDAAIADLPVPDLTGVCPENAPTNVSFAAAAPLPTLDAYGRVRVGAGVSAGNDDGSRSTHPSTTPYGWRSTTPWLRATRRPSISTSTT